MINLDGYIGTRVRHHRTRYNLTPALYARMLNGHGVQLTGDRVKEIEAGEPILLIEAVAVAKAMGVTLDQLVTGRKRESVKPTELGRAAGLSRERVYQIKQRRR